MSDLKIIVPGFPPKRRGSQPISVLEELAYSNFKAFGQLRLDVRPITVFLGPNNSGKSSILAGPKLLTQTVESFDSDVTLLLNGIFGDYGTYRDVVFQNRRTRPMEILLSLRHPRDPVVAGTRDLRRQHINISSSLRLKYRYRSYLKQIILSEIELASGDKCLLKTKYSDSSEKAVITLLGGVKIPPASRASLSRRLRLQHFIPQAILVLFHGDIARSLLGGRTERVMRDLRRAGNAFHRFFKRIEYVGAIRAEPARAYLFSGETRARVGASGEHAINIMVMDTLRSDRRTLNIRKRVVRWLKKAGIAGDLRLRSLSDRHYEIHLKHPITGEYSNFADVGYGNSQIIPVLVAGYNLQPGGTLLVEQPEIHLHPKAQAELGDFFFDLYCGGTQSLVETHSEHLVLRLQQHVANKLLRADEIVFYYVYARGRQKRAVKMTLDNDGRFTQEWPEGFFPERLKEAKKLAKARLMQNVEN